MRAWRNYVDIGIQTIRHKIEFVWWCMRTLVVSGGILWGLFLLLPNTRAQRYYEDGRLSALESQVERLYKQLDQHAAASSSIESRTARLEQVVVQLQRDTDRLLVQVETINNRLTMIIIGVLVFLVKEFFFLMRDRLTKIA